MIRSFKNKLAEDLYNGVKSKETRKFPAELVKGAETRLSYISYAKTLEDLKVPPGNRFEALKGDLKGRYSIRINDQWRIVFGWDGEGATEVEVIDYH